jgi:Thioredoxin-like proteins and domains
MTDAQEAAVEPPSSVIEIAAPGETRRELDADGQIDMAALESTIEYIRPALQADGGDVVLLGTHGGTVTLQLVGACGGCPLSTMTLVGGIERILKDRVPGVTDVEAV